MSIDFEFDPTLIDPIEARKSEIKTKIIDATARAGATIIASTGFEAMVNPKNKENIKKIFASVRNKVLQKYGVLDENSDVVLGQEMYVNL